MRERVRIYVGERLTGITGRQKPTVAFDLQHGVELHDALRELAASMKRIKNGELVEGPPRCQGAQVDLRASPLVPQGAEMTQQKYMRQGLDFAVGKTVEEMGELQAALGKTLRWGWLSANPELPVQEQETNLAWVRREAMDVKGSIDNLLAELDRDPLTRSEPPR